MSLEFAVGSLMIDIQLIQLIVVFIEAIGILLVEKQMVLYLYLATILTIIIFFMT